MPQECKLFIFPCVVSILVKLAVPSFMRLTWKMSQNCCTV